jgi:hypothetical protein
MIYPRRLTLDLDSLNEWDVYRVYDQLGCLGLNPILYRTRNGYHIEAELPPEAETFMDIIRLRRKFGDDPKRIDFDIWRITQGHFCDVLFDVRRGRKRLKNPSLSLLL